MIEPLDNPVWHALIGPHARFAQGHGFARHYPRDMAPFSGIVTASPAAYTDLAVGLPFGKEARLFRPCNEPLPDGWVSIDAFPMLQMVAAMGSPPPSKSSPYSVLAGSDLSAMMDLAAVAKPGPFGLRTPELGTTPRDTTCGAPAQRHSANSARCIARKRKTSYANASPTSG